MVRIVTTVIYRAITACRVKLCTRTINTEEVKATHIGAAVVSRGGSMGHGARLGVWKLRSLLSGT